MRSEGCGGSQTAATTSFGVFLTVPLRFVGSHHENGIPDCHVCDKCIVKYL